jgi:hypothetical protein
MSFDGIDGLEEEVDLAKGLFEKYAGVTDFAVEIVD